MSGVTINVIDLNTGKLDTELWGALSSFFAAKNDEILSKLKTGKTPLRIFYQVLDYKYITASLDVISKYTEERRVLGLEERKKVNDKVNALLYRVGVRVTKKEGGTYQVELETRTEQSDLKPVAGRVGAVSPDIDMTTEQRNDAIKQYANRLADELMQEVNDLSAMLAASVRMAVSDMQVARKVDTNTGKVTEELDIDGNPITTSRYGKTEDELREAVENAARPMAQLRGALKSRRGIMVTGEEEGDKDAASSADELATTKRREEQAVLMDKAESFMALARSLADGANVGDADKFKSIFNTSGSKLKNVLGAFKNAYVTASAASTAASTAVKAAMMRRASSSGLPSSSGSQTGAATTGNTMPAFAAAAAAQRPVRVITGYDPDLRTIYNVDQAKFIEFYILLNPEGEPEKISGKELSKKLLEKLKAGKEIGTCEKEIEQELNKTGVVPPPVPKRPPPRKNS